MLRKLMGAAFALAIAAAPAEAQWKYEFSGTFLDGPVVFDDVTNEIVVDGRLPATYQFVLFSPTPIVGPGQVSPTSCTITDSFLDVFYECESPGPGMAQNGFGTGISLVDAKFVKFDAGHVPQGGGGAFFWFDPVAFSTPGVYTRYDFIPNGPSIQSTMAQCQAAGGTSCQAVNFYGSAGDATLVVTNVSAAAVVPEPSTYLLLASGLLGIGVLARRSRVRASRTNRVAR